MYLRINLLRTKIIFILLLFVSLIINEVFSLGTEIFGNEPVPNDEQWSKGVVSVVNLESRVYSRWVNGDESVYYRGNTDALNDALEKFAMIESENLEIIIRPGPGKTNTFDRDPIEFDWELHMPSGIYLVVAREESMINVFNKYETMSIFIGDGNIVLEEIKIPDGVSVIGSDELRDRYIQGLKNGNQHTRLYAAGLLGHLAPFDEGAILPLIGALDDNAGDVRMQAVVSVSRFGIRSVAALPKLRGMLKNCGENEKSIIEDAIRNIKKSESEEVKTYHTVLNRINEFQKSLSENREK